MKIIIGCLFLGLFFISLQKTFGKEVAPIIVEYENSPDQIEMVIFDDFYGGVVALRIRQNPNYINEKKEKSIKKAVEFLTSHKKPLEMGNGYTFSFLGGYPFWKKNTGEINGVGYLYIYFAKVMIANKKTLYVWGDIGKEDNYHYSKKAGWEQPQWERRKK